MKKLRKIAAVLSAAIMSISILSLQVSAYFDDLVYDTIETDSTGKKIPIRTWERVAFDGIVVTMSDSTAPTAEELGIDCPVSKYDAASCGSMLDSSDVGWTISKSVEPEENQYFLDSTDIMSEEEAISFAKKLMVRGKVKKAEVLYNYCISTGQIYGNGEDNAIIFEFNNKEAAENFSIDKYPEIKETLQFADYKFQINQNLFDGSQETYKVVVYGSYIDTPYNSDKLDALQIYNDVNKYDVMTAKYEELEKADLWFLFPVSDIASNVVYSVNPTWGDATNDDVIDLYDVIEISKYILDISDMNDDAILLADINHDGKTDLYDAIEIAKITLSK